MCVRDTIKEKGTINLWVGDLGMREKSWEGLKGEKGELKWCNSISVKNIEQQQQQQTLCLCMDHFLTQVCNILMLRWGLCLLDFCNTALTWVGIALSGAVAAKAVKSVHSKTGKVWGKWNDHRSWGLSDLMQQRPKFFIYKGEVTQNCPKSWSFFLTTQQMYLRVWTVLMNTS